MAIELVMKKEYIPYVIVFLALMFMLILSFILK